VQASVEDPDEVAHGSTGRGVTATDGPVGGQRTYRQRVRALDEQGEIGRQETTTEPAPHVGGERRAVQVQDDAQVTIGEVA
jgi:hypothetical protein